jgi:hypothetical protein
MRPEVSGMSQLTPVFLTIHILTAIVAFGPSFAFPLISRMAAQQPQHGLFAVQLTHLIERRIILPAAITMPISGLLLVWSEGINLLATHWLLLAIALFIVAIGFSVLIQLPTIERMIEVLGAMTSGGAAFAAGPGAALARPASAGAAGATIAREGATDPRLEMARLGARAQAGGITLTLLVVVIVALMASKPTL